MEIVRPFQMYYLYLIPVYLSNIHKLRNDHKLTVKTRNTVVKCILHSAKYHNKYSCINMLYFDTFVSEIIVNKFVW